MTRALLQTRIETRMLRNCVISHEHSETILRRWHCVHGRVWDVVMCCMYLPSWPRQRHLDLNANLLASRDVGLNGAWKLWV